MSSPVLICNQAYCKLCETLVISHSQHDFNSCKCGAISVDGGTDYRRRIFKSIAGYEDRCIYSDAPFEVIRENLYRGSRGKDGKQPLTWIKLCDIGDEYLANLIDYMEFEGHTGGVHYPNYLKERDYRSENTQKCKEV